MRITFNLKYVATVGPLLLALGCAGQPMKGDSVKDEAKKEQAQAFIELLGDQPTAAGGYGLEAEASLIFVQTHPQYMGSQSYYATVRIIQAGGPAATHKVVQKSTMSDGSVNDREGERLNGGDYGPADYRISTAYGGMGYPYLTSWYFEYTSTENGVETSWILDADGLRPAYEGPYTQFNFSQMTSLGGYGPQYAGNWKRTIIFMYGETEPGQDMYFRGGIDHGFAQSNMGKTCTSTNYLCAIPVYHVNRYPNAWRPGDFHLDWYGTEMDQLNSSEGSPLVWTTNEYPPEWLEEGQYPPHVDQTGYGVTQLNKWGHHYWMLDVVMDCDYTAGGWFELKSYISNGPGWEGDAQQPNSPYQSNNHFGECGKINMFRRGDNNVEITSFDDVPPYHIPDYY